MPQMGKCPYVTNRPDNLAAKNYVDWGDTISESGVNSAVTEWVLPQNDIILKENG